jgi:hypothetical protein
MKLGTQFILMMAAANLAAASPASQAVREDEPIRQLHVALSLHYPEADIPLLEKKLIDFCLATAPPSFRIEFDDTAGKKVITTIDVPDLKFPSQDNRLRRVSRQVAELTTWFKALPQRRASDPLRGTAALNIQDYCWSITEQPFSGRRAILLIGSPRHLSLSEAAWNFVGDRYPDDGCIFTNTAVTPYGCADRQGRLSNCVVHFCYLDEQAFPNPNYLAKVRRFWAMWVAAQGGILASFTPDLGQTLAQVIRTDLRPVSQDVPRNTHVGMSFAPPRGLSDFLSRNATDASPSATSSSGSGIDLPPELARMNGIGLMWSEPVDIDLYTRAKSSSPEVFFAQKTAPELKYYHDFTSANSRLDYEFVEFIAPVDLRAVEAWANLYAGETANAHGRVAVFWNGRAHYSDFRIQASRGNQGADRSLREASIYWTRLHPAQIVGLAP